MGMAMDQGFHAVGLHDPRYFFRRDIDDVIGLHPHLGRAFAAQLARQFLPGAQGQMAQDEQGHGVTQVASQLHIADIAGAEAVAVHQQHRLAVKLHDTRVLQ
ncbi:hypothetical protein PS685_05337 [Pseudomonas fluorescens]|uniref:Uncharacterized protein n=1 Tax=Pseudomonas fluorescens TaxID=294 RepID=A0A5E7ALR5_PSEFL|nr:hypothetical protein PS685_05337 [Pseudomonas fluorescens]